MSTTRIVTLILVPLLLATERMAYYGTRATLFLDMMRRMGMTASEASNLVMAQQGVSLLATVVGGAVAIAIGPRIPVIAGVAVAMIGYVLLAIVGPTALPLMVLGLGIGAMKACVWAILADAVATEETPSGATTAPESPRRFALMAAMAAASYGAINLGAAVSAPAAMAVVDRSGIAAANYFAVAIMVVPLVVSIVLAVLPQPGSAKTAAAPQHIYREAAPMSAPQLRASAGSGVLGLLVIVAAAAPMEAGSPAAFAAIPHLGLTMTYASVQSLTTVFGAGVALVSLLVLALTRAAVPPTLPMGIGLLLVSLGLAVLGAAPSAAVYLLASGLMGLGEPLATAVGMMYASMVAPSRFRALAVAGWLLSTSLISMAASRLGEWWRPLALSMAFFGVIGAILLIALGRRLHRFAFDPA